MQRLPGDMHRASHSHGRRAEQGGQVVLRHGGRAVAAVVQSHPALGQCSMACGQPVGGQQQHQLALQHVQLQPLDLRVAMGCDLQVGMASSKKPKHQGSSCDGAARVSLAGTDAAPIPCAERAAASACAAWPLHSATITTSQTLQARSLCCPATPFMSGCRVSHRPTACCARPRTPVRQYGRVHRRSAVTIDHKNRIRSLDRRARPPHRHRKRAFERAILSAARQGDLKPKMPWLDGTAYLRVSPLKRMQRPPAPMPQSASRRQLARSVCLSWVGKSRPPRRGEVVRLHRPAGHDDWPLSKVQETVASLHDEWKVSARADVRRQNLSDCSQSVPVRQPPYSMPTLRDPPAGSVSLPGGASQAMRSGRTNRPSRFARHQQEQRRCRC